MKRFVLLLFSALPLLAQTAKYPSNVVTDEQLKVQVNGMQTILTANVTNTATTIPVAACGTIPANSLATMDQEIVAVLSCAGNTVTIDTSAQGCTSGRGCDNTTPSAHVTNALFSLYVDAWHHNALRVEIEAIETALGANLANVVTVGGAINVTVNSGGAAVSGTNSGSGVGISGTGANGAGVSGLATSGNGVIGQSTTGYGVVGYATNASGTGVHAVGTGGGLALLVDGPETLNGVLTVTGGGASTIAGTISATITSGGDAVSGTNNGTGAGVLGTGGSGAGVSGIASSGDGVTGQSTSGPGVVGQSTSGIGVHAIGSTTAFQADGPVVLNSLASGSGGSALCVTSGGSVYKGPC